MICSYMKTPNGIARLKRDYFLVAAYQYYTIPYNITLSQVLPYLIPGISRQVLVPFHASVDGQGRAFSYPAYRVGCNTARTWPWYRSSCRASRPSWLACWQKQEAWHRYSLWTRIQSGAKPDAGPPKLTDCFRCTCRAQETILRKHTSDVSDISWSQQEEHLLVSASHSIFCWDTRAAQVMHKQWIQYFRVAKMTAHI